MTSSSQRGWVLGVMLCAACASTPKASLYDQLGGQDGIAKLADAMIVETRADPRINALFSDTEEDYFRARLIEQMCVLADGPYTYEGLSMVDAHSGMDISESEFTWFVEDVERAMVSVGLPLPVQNRLLAKFARMRQEVIRQ